MVDVIVGVSNAILLLMRKGCCHLRAYTLPQLIFCHVFCACLVEPPSARNTTGLIHSMIINPSPHVCVSVRFCVQVRDWDVRRGPAVAVSLLPLFFSLFLFFSFFESDNFSESESASLYVDTL